MRILLACLCLYLLGPRLWSGETGVVVRPELLKAAFGEKLGAFVLMDCASGAVFCSDADACAEKVAPCSTFKIWNSAIGLELGLVRDPDASFWKWDGHKREYDAWNKDQTLRSAFSVSCVPAYQELARAIGRDRMQNWLDKIGYGNRDLSAGIDVFWLPAPGRQTLLISPREQAQLVALLVEGKLPFSTATLPVLKEVMRIKTTASAAFYGKTGTGADGLGWFVGFVEAAGGHRYSFACLLRGTGVTGKDARGATERVLSGAGLL